MAVRRAGTRSVGGVIAGSVSAPSRPIDPTDESRPVVVVRGPRGDPGTPGADGAPGIQGPPGPTDIVGDELTIKNSDGLVPGATPAVIKHCRDPINPGGGGAALVLTPGVSASGTRIVIGNPADKSYAVNFSGVYVVEAMPGFNTTDGFTHGYGNGSHMIGRSGGEVRVNASGGGAAHSWWLNPASYGGIGSGSTERMRLDADGLRVKVGVGFFDAAPTGTRPTVTGSRSDGTALASLLTALATLGLITDGSTA